MIMGTIEFSAWQMELLPRDRLSGLLKATLKNGQDGKPTLLGWSITERVRDQCLPFRRAANLYHKLCALGALAKGKNSSHRFGERERSREAESVSPHRESFYFGTLKILVKDLLMITFRNSWSIVSHGNGDAFPVGHTSDKDAFLLVFECV
jgi:hypothetical protein